jgi:hypothetical protein
MKPAQKLGNPFFIISVFLLVINDWYFKRAFGNGLTGKLSDFAGLFAFPYLLSVLFPRRVIGVYLFTLLAFIIWKSPTSQPVIDAFNHIGLPVDRTIDYSDYIALAVLPFSFLVFNRSLHYHLKPVLINTIIVFSSVAFMATAMPRGNYTWFAYADKTYDFNFSKRELVARVNKLQVEFVRDIDNYGNGVLDFDSQTNVFYGTDKKDTIAQLLDYEKVKDTDTIWLRTSYARIKISGNENSSALKLISLKGFIPQNGSADYKAKWLKAFERHVVKKLKKI